MMILTSLPFLTTLSILKRSLSVKVAVTLLGKVKPFGTVKVVVKLLLISAVTIWLPSPE